MNRLLSYPLLLMPGIEVISPVVPDSEIRLSPLAAYHTSMNVIGIVSSPRKGANSQTLVEAILAGAEDTGAVTELIRLPDLDINPCTSCFSCRNQDECAQQDAMCGLYEKIVDADAVVFGSPIYFARLNAQAYPFLDRLFALLNPDFTPRIPPGKKIVTVLTCNSCGREILDPVNEYLKNIFALFGFVDAGYIWQNNLLLPDDIAKYPEKLVEARNLGRSLIQE